MVDNVINVHVQLRGKALSEDAFDVVFGGHELTPTTNVVRVGALK